MKKKLDISVSTTSLPAIRMNEDVLSMTFLDWNNQTIAIGFESVFAFRWMDAAGFDETVDDDTAYEISHSDWIAELSEKIQHARQNVSRYRHYQFCICECWVFEVICDSFSYTVLE